MHRLSICFYFFIVGFTCKLNAQPTLTGRILDESSFGMPGVTILEEGLTNGMVSDLQGNFTLTLSKPGVAKISSIGYLDQKIRVSADTSILVQMLPDSVSELLGTVISCFIFETRVSKIGLNFGTNHSMFGIESQNFIYSIGRLKTKIHADVVWRMIGEEPYLDLQLRRFDLLNGNSLSIGINWQYKFVSNADSKTEFYAISPDLSYKGYFLSFGYAQRITELENRAVDNGISIGFQKYFLKHFKFKAESMLFSNEQLFKIKLHGQIPSTPFILGIGWEKFQDWQELDLSVMYRFRY